MNRRLIAISVLVIVALASCRKETWDEFYGRPETLPPPIYQTLASKGNFTHLLAAIDKAGYKDILSAAGYWTFFAPHDSAFKVYLSEKGVSGVDQLDSNSCRQIVTYCLVYNGFKKERIGDFQSTSTIGWVPNQAFRRRTANYVGVYDTKDTSGNSIKAISANRNGTANYVDADNNNKYITYFVDNFMSAKGLNASDYNYFYPNATYTGFNVLDATVTAKDILTENGIIHIVNKVMVALPSIDEYLASKPEYSEFKKLFDRFLVSYLFNQGVTTKYNNINSTNARVYTKMFSAAIGFSLNNENFLKQQDNDGQQNCYSIFVPDNTTLKQYINTVLLEHYPSVESMPPSIIYDFINAHLWQNAVWPSKFTTTYNVVNEEARFDPVADITDKKIVSNGIFYGTRKVQEANVFTSVYGKAYLDPQYSMMVSLLNLELKGQISNIHRNYTLFMISNAVLNAAGYFADPTVSNDVTNQWRFVPPPGSTLVGQTGANARIRLQRIINLHVVPNKQLKNLSAEGVALTYGGEYIGFKNGTVYAPGNVEAGNVATVVNTKTALNGPVYYLDRILDFSDAVIGTHLEKLAGTSAGSSPYYHFFQFLKNATPQLWNTTTKDITGLPSGTFCTIFIPNNAAIQQAVNDGLLPGTGTAPNKVPTFNPTLTTEKEQVVRFIQYHILAKKIIAADQVENGAMETLLKNDLGEPTTLFIDNSGSNLKVSDAAGVSANIISTVSYYLSNRCMVHLTDNYLRY
ncbi:Fasciclin domain-containing protein [Filimonas lacunae]|uniref:Fasciclin domain-containing protein n=2 Tax=Filimonas lacunae TaxID=477680 RepID=A0A1N7N8X2_9BACT|nr:Fasciclin domain-containing protein [Filimonas lacunae]